MRSITDDSTVTSHDGSATNGSSTPPSKLYAVQLYGDGVSVGVGGAEPVGDSVYVCVLEPLAVEERVLVREAGAVLVPVGSGVPDALAPGDRLPVGVGVVERVTDGLGVPVRVGDPVPVDERVLVLVAVDERVGDAVRGAVPVPDALAPVLGVPVGGGVPLGDPVPDGVTDTGA
jgi:hypothetical protein